MADRTASAPRLTGDPPPLIFDWRRPRGVKRRLAAWLVVVAAGHAALFYLFRVAPPVVSRKPPPQQAVLYLPPSDAAVRTLLGALDDRYPGALLRPEEYTLKADMEALAKITPPAVPSWAAHRPALKPYPQPLVSQDLPGLFQPGDPVLPWNDPELPLSTGAEPGKSASAPSVIIDEFPGERTLVRQPEWPDKLFDELPSGSASFKLGVLRSGAPEYCMSLSPAAGVDLEAVRRVLMGLRFSPVGGGGQWQWITVTVRW